MSPVKYVEFTKAVFAAQGFPPYEWAVNDAAPFTSFQRNLEECRVALLSAGGLYVKVKQSPFDPDKNDLSFREIPKDIDVREIAISHNWYDHTDADKDVNCVFPIERLRELEQEGYIGELSPLNYTIMGRIFRRTALQANTAEEIVKRLKEQEVAILLLVAS